MHPETPDQTLISNPATQVAAGWVNPEYMRGFTFDGAAVAAPPAQGASSLGGITSSATSPTTPCAQTPQPSTPNPTNP